MERIVIETTEEIKQKLKVMAAKKHMTMKDLLHLAIEHILHSK